MLTQPSLTSAMNLWSWDEGRLARASLGRRHKGHGIWMFEPPSPYLRDLCGDSRTPEELRHDMDSGDVPEEPLDGVCGDGVYSWG